MTQQGWDTLAKLGPDAAKPIFELRDTLAHQFNTMLDWQHIWLIPCIMAAVVAVLFLLTFRDDARPAADAEKETESVESPSAT